MPKTVQEHFDDCKKVSEVIANANRLLEQTRSELICARTILEKLREFQHPKMEIPIEYMSWFSDRKIMNPLEVIDLEIARINKLLGDRA